MSELFDMLKDYDENLPDCPILDKLYDWEYEKETFQFPLSLSPDYLFTYDSRDFFRHFNEKDSYGKFGGFLTEEELMKIEELEDAVRKLTRDNEYLKDKLAEEQEKRKKDLKKFDEKLEKQKQVVSKKLESQIKKLQKKNDMLEKTIETYRSYDKDMYLLNDLNKLREEAQELRDEMFQIREDTKSSKKELSNVKKECQFYTERLINLENETNKDKLFSENKRLRLENTVLKNKVSKLASQLVFYVNEEFGEYTKGE